MLGTYLPPYERTNTCEKITFQQLGWRTVICNMELCCTYHVVGLEGVGLLYVLIMWYSPCSWTGRCRAPLCTGYGR